MKKNKTTKKNTRKSKKTEKKEEYRGGSTFCSTPTKGKGTPWRSKEYRDECW